MKNINYLTKGASRFSKALLLIILFCSFTPSNDLIVSSCQYDFELKDSYSVKKPETVIVKALRDYGFDVKRGLNGSNEENSRSHIWRILNVRTKHGIVKEIIIQTAPEGSDVDRTTRILLMRMCLNEELTEKELNSKIKKYRTFFKKQVIDKLKRYRE